MPNPSQADPHVDCVGFVVLTETTDYAGRKSCQHSPIYRSPPQIAGGDTPGATHTIVPVFTAFPLSDVLAGEATRWEDWTAQNRARAA